MTPDQVRGMLYGLAVGDALGVPYEFKGRGTFHCDGMAGHGTHNRPAGTWSDDTAMTLATLHSLIENGWNVDPNDLLARYRNGSTPAPTRRTARCSTAASPARPPSAPAAAPRASARRATAA